MLSVVFDMLAKRSRRDCGNGVVDCSDGLLKVNRLSWNEGTFLNIPAESILKFRNASHGLEGCVHVASISQADHISKMTRAQGRRAYFTNPTGFAS